MLEAPEIPTTTAERLEDIRFGTAHPPAEPWEVDLSNWYWYQYEPHLDTINRIMEQQ